MRISELEADHAVTKDKLKNATEENCLQNAELDIARDKEAFLRNRGDSLFTRVLELSNSLGNSQHQQAVAQNLLALV